MKNIGLEPPVSNRGLLPHPHPPCQRFIHKIPELRPLFGLHTGQYHVTTIAT
jgi:hypothetical protein